MKKLINFLAFFTFSVFLIFQVGINNADAFDRSAEVAEYLDLLKSNNVTKQIETAKIISQAALSDPELFDFINQKLLNEYQSHTGSSKHIDFMAWLCKALASSGMSKYKATLQQVAETTQVPKINKYAIQSLAMVDVYAKQNATIYAGVDASQNPEITKLINMLKSDDITLKRNAAKKITRSDFTSPQLFDVVNEELMIGYAINTRDKQHVDTMAWLCKALSASGMQQYAKTLQEVAENTTNDKLQKYALQSYKALVAQTSP